MQEHKIVVPRTAHYYTLGNPGEHIKYFWFVTHGYGQAAQRFISKFEEIKRDDTLVVAPEGLSRFYWNGFTGEVVSSWMTKKGRLDEIKDYANYLTKVFHYYKEQLPSDVTIVLMGFSQGVATQFRWIMRESPDFDYLILWAGMIPEDLDYQEKMSYFQERELFFIYGDEDQFLNPARLEEHEKIVNRFNFQLRKHQFQGKHRVDRKVLHEIDHWIRG